MTFKYTFVLFTLIILYKAKRSGSRIQISLYLTAQSTNKQADGKNKYHSLFVTSAKSFLFAFFSDIKGLTEETAIGVQNLYRLAKEKQLEMPAISINDSVTKVGASSNIFHHSVQGHWKTIRRYFAFALYAIVGAWENNKIQIYLPHYLYFYFFHL